MNYWFFVYLWKETKQYIETENQIQMITLEQLVAPDSWARIIDLFVDILPIDKLGVKHVKLQSEGRPPYNPVTLLKLYLLWL